MQKDYKASIPAWKRFCIYIVVWLFYFSFQQIYFFNHLFCVKGESGAEAQEEDSDVAQAEVTDGDIMDGEAETDTVVIAGQPEVLSTQEMQVSKFPSMHLVSKNELTLVRSYHLHAIFSFFNLGGD